MSTATPGSECTHPFRFGPLYATVTQAWLLWELGRGRDR
jgi:hypothetical protein